MSFVLDFQELILSWISSYLTRYFPPVSYWFLPVNENMPQGLTLGLHPFPNYAHFSKILPGLTASDTILILEPRNLKDYHLAGSPTSAFLNVCCLLNVSAWSSNSPVRCESLPLLCLKPSKGSCLAQSKSRSHQTGL